ncbi:TrmB family transcriptional regulator [Treponema sp. OMZ 840]|uniref:TrmB family transcriptional regulator n=1 Tax=Treponema sp. OMZ 840 TaxID=244313 RepID=UPI003D8A058B
MTEKMVFLLKNFGFTESESRVYVSLLESGPCTGYEVSKISAVPRSKVYGVLETLLQKGAVALTRRDKKILYNAQSVSEVSGVIEKKITENLNRLRKQAQEIGEPESKEDIWNLYSMDAVKVKIYEMLNRASKEICVQIWADELDSCMEDCLVKKQRELGKVLVVLYDLSGKYKTKITHVYKHGFEQEKLAELGNRWLVVTVDGEETLSASIKENGKVEATYTKNSRMVFFAKEYALHDAYSLKMIEHLKKQVTTEFGDDMKELRNVFSFQD